MKHFWLLMTYKSVAAVLLILVATSTASTEIKIGWIGPLTGNAAILGRDTIPAIQMVFDSINASGGIGGEKLTLVIEDDQYVTSKSVQAYQRLVHAENIKILFLLTYGGVMALSERAQKDGVLILDTLDCDEKIATLPSNTLCIAKSTEALGAAVADLVVKRGDSPPALIYYDGDPFMGTAAKATLKRFQDSGVSPSIVETYSDDTTDFRTMLGRVRSKRETKSIILYGYDQLGLAAKQARELGFEVQLYGLNTVESSGFQKLAGSAVEGLFGAVFLAERTPAFAQFEADFVKRIGRKPQFETSTVPSFDGASLLTKALLEGGYSVAQKSVVVDVVREYLLKTKNYQGLAGTISMDPDGAVRTIRVTQVVVKGGVMQPIQ